ncbi:MAG TPA: tetratricopeptide repeat protein [Spirochaetota bacterium]|nr:tetratricopeptide repeat protein [Spirochaetota bacterium]HRZ25995.1 tetratricopeptide repeat protein [Spirochaetota bacterium]
MGDSEKAITYTPEELAEINRIIASISSAPPVPEMKAEAPAVKKPQQKPVEQPDEYFGEPEDLDLPTGDLDKAVSEEKFEEDFSSAEEALLDEDLSLPEEDATLADSLDLGEEIKLDESDLEEISSEDLQDISDFVQIEEAPEEAGEAVKPAPEPRQKLTEKLAEKFAEKFPRKPKKAATPLDQLDALTAGEPESLDSQDISEERFTDEAAEEAAPAQAEAGEQDEFADIEGIDLGEPVPEIKPGKKEKPAGVSLEKEAETEIPDLSDISIDDAGSIPEAGVDDIPEIDLGEISDGKKPAARADKEASLEEEFIEPGLDELGNEDLVDLGNLTDITSDKKSTTKMPEPEAEIPDIGITEEALDEIDKIDIGEIEEKRPGKPPREEEFTVEPMDEDEPARPSKRPAPAAYRADESGESVELSDRELKRLKKAILLFNPALISVIKDVIVRDLLSPGDTRQLVDLIVTGRPEENVHRFLERKLNRKIDLRKETPSGRRVLYSRAEYTREGRERQRRLFRMTKIFAVAAAVGFIITILTYQFAYKPYMARKLIAQGVSLIRERGDYQKKPGDYRKAEELFKRVHEDYRENYLPGYTAYGRAYFDMKEYSHSLDKLNRAFEIDPRDPEVLNGLGYYYSRVPNEYYRSIKGSVNRWYYKGKKPEMAQQPQLEVAINFYKMVLQRDKENVTALFGIGNAYFHQGEYLKAKKFYEDILKVDPDSPIGYAGLMNLYVERDSFPQVASLHAEIREKELMPELPSALLGKLAEYYLSKRRSDDSSVRIDYGVKSPRIIDDEDNTYPAVRSVLKDLAKRDPDYPPLQVHWARLNRAQKNYALMEKYLQKAIDLSPNYFGALHLLGEYHYFTNEPVKSYEYLNRAVNAHSNRPDFTLDDFYKETEELGKTYSIMGNIFYYFFDKLRYRYGDLEDEMIEDDKDKYLNYSIAREKYEEAQRQGFKSPEVHYNLGRIYYLDKLYQDALDQWLNLYEEFVTRPELMFSLGNAFYHLGNYEAGKGEYLKLADAYEADAERITMVQYGNKDHIRIFRTLSAAYNNLGAIYQIQNNESKSGICYWKSVDYAKQLETENAIARVNLARSFNREIRTAPILDEEIPYSIDIYREDMR